jgi:hypothetical protein
MVSAEAPEDFIRRLVHVGEANVRAIQGYAPRPLAEAVHLFLPVTAGGLAEIAGREIAADADHGWKSRIGQAIATHTVPGDHFTMMSGDGAVQIARELSELLSAVGTARILDGSLASSR